jgi:hypothetical protein
MDGCWNVWELGCRIDWEAWAAIFTALAVAIALGLGVWPILLQKARDRARSRALGMYAAANLDVQYLWVRVAHDVGGMRPLTPAVYNKAIGFALNASDGIFSEAVREIDSFPPYVAEAISNCATQIMLFTTMVLFSRWGADGSASGLPGDPTSG